MRIPRACIQSTEPVARQPAGSQLRETLGTRHRRKGEDSKQQGASGIYLDPENSFFHNKRKGKGRKRKAPTPGPAAHIRSPWRTGVQPLLWAEGRPGGPAPVAGSSRPPCTPPGRQTARAGCAAAAPLTAPLSTRSHPRASTSVGTGDTTGQERGGVRHRRPDGKDERPDTFRPHRPRGGRTSGEPCEAWGGATRPGRLPVLFLQLQQVLQSLPASGLLLSSPLTHLRSLTSRQLTRVSVPPKAGCLSGSLRSPSSQTGAC